MKPITKKEKLLDYLYFSICIVATIGYLFY